MWNEMKLTHRKSWWNKFNFYCLFVFKTDATIYVGGLDEKVTETLLWELFLQAGPVGKQVCRLGGGRTSSKLLYGYVPPNVVMFLGLRSRKECNIQANL